MAVRRCHQFYAKCDENLQEKIHDTRLVNSVAPPPTESVPVHDNNPSSLPNQPIKVDGRSLVDLKAIVYAKEQKVKLDGGGGSGGLRGLRGKRSSGDRAGGAGARKDPFARSNKGVEDRSERDEFERVTASKKKKAAERVMAAKSSLYEKMGK